MLGVAAHAETSDPVTESAGDATTDVVVAVVRRVVVAIRKPEAVGVALGRPAAEHARRTASLTTGAPAFAGMVDR
jgi:hypothetical protein